MQLTFWFDMIAGPAQAPDARLRTPSPVPAGPLPRPALP